VVLEKEKVKEKKAGPAFDFTRQKNSFCMRGLDSVGPAFFSLREKNRRWRLNPSCDVKEVVILPPFRQPGRKV